METGLAPAPGCRQRLRRGFVVVLLAGSGPWTSPPVGQLHASDQQPPGTTAAAPWEREIEPGLFEHRGVARIERLGPRPVLTVLCDGIHTTYLADQATEVPTRPDSYVRARYRYVERAVPDAACVQAPCVVTERVMHIERLIAVSSTRDQAQALARSCGPRGAEGR